METNQIVSVLFFLNIVSFAYSVFFLFKRTDSLNKEFYLYFQIITVFSWIVFLYHIISKRDAEMWRYILSSILMSVSLLMFWYQSNIIKKNTFLIIFSEQKPSAVFIGGLFRYVRHPFYLSYILCYLGVLIYITHLLVALCVMLLIGIYYYAARTEEKRIIKSESGHVYAEYQNSVGMLFPKLWKISKKKSVCTKCGHSLVLVKDKSNHAKLQCQNGHFIS